MKPERLSVGNTAPELSVINISGEVVNVSALWAQGPTLLTFLRHFG